MTNLDKYKEAFVDAFEISEDILKENPEYNSIAEWDSIGHMSLISELEEALDIMMETDDVIEFGSFEKGKEILKRYQVEVN
jgi:acyl carrier protein